MRVLAVPLFILTKMNISCNCHLPCLRMIDLVGFRNATLNCMDSFDCLLLKFIRFNPGNLNKTNKTKHFKKTWWRLTPVPCFKWCLSFKAFVGSRFCMQIVVLLPLLKISYATPSHVTYILPSLLSIYIFFH